MLKPGNLPTDLGGGSFDNTPYNNSMAAEIETQLNQLLTTDGLQAMPLDNSQETRDRRRLFVAIARGVVKHLRDNADAIDVHETIGPITHPTINTEGLPP